MSYIGKDVNNKFFSRWSNNMAYILGYWFADGCIYTRKYGTCFNIVSTDLEILEKIKNVMKSKHTISKRKPSKSHWKLAYVLSISNNDIYNDIKKLGGVERKSLVSKFPYVPKKFLNHFIRGFFDGDGSISIRYRNNPVVSFYGTEDFLFHIQKYLPCQAKVKPEKSIYGIHYSGQRAQKVLKYMYKNAEIFLERKYQNYKKGMTWYPIRIPKYTTGVVKRKMQNKQLVVEIPESLSIEINKFLADKAQGKSTHGMQRLMLVQSLYILLLKKKWKVNNNTKKDYKKIIKNARFKI